MKLLYIKFLIFFLLFGCSSFDKARIPASSQADDCLELIGLIIEGSRTTSYSYDNEVSHLIDPVEDELFKNTLSKRKLITNDPIIRVSYADPYIEGIGFYSRFSHKIDPNIKSRINELLLNGANVDEALNLLDSYFYSYLKKHFPDKNLAEIKKAFKLALELKGKSGGFSLEKNIDTIRFLDELRPFFHSNANDETVMTLAFQILFRDTAMKVNLDEFFHFLTKRGEIIVSPEEIKQFLSEWNNVLALKELAQSDTNFYNMDLLIDNILFAGRFRKANEVDSTIKEDLYQLSKQPAMQIIGTSDSRGIQSSYSVLITLLEKLKLSQGEKFVDLGSGYGRVTNFVGLTHPEVKVEGYEYVAKRVDFSNTESARFSLDNVVHKKQDLGDEAFPLAIGDVYYMYDPFAEDVMEIVVQKLAKIAKDKKIKIVVSSGWSDAILSKLSNQSWLRQTFEIQHKHSEKFIIFESIK